MKTIASPILLLGALTAAAACSSDPLDPGSGNAAGSGTNSLFVNGRADASPRIANAPGSADYITDFALGVSLGTTRITTGTVTITSRTGSVGLVWHDNGGALGQWEGSLPGYDEVYQLDVVAGADAVHGVIVDGPDIAVITAPTAGATLDATVANMLTWSRDDAAEIATFRTDQLDRITIPDSGSYSIAPGSMKYDNNQARQNTLELRRTNRVVPAGAVAGSEFSVMIEQQLDVVAQPAP